jgi:hypothetical protein
MGMPLQEVAARGDRRRDAGPSVRSDPCPHVLGEGLSGALREIEQKLLAAFGRDLGGGVAFTRGRSEWQLSAAPRRLIWEVGPDAPFLANAVALLVVGAAAVWAYSELSRAARTARRSAA